MKQKTLLTIRAFVCFALTALLGFLCFLPLFSFNVKISNQTVNELSSVLEFKKSLLQSEESNSSSAKKEIEKLDDLIDDLQAAQYSQTFNLETLAIELVQKCEDGDTVLPYGLKTKEDIEAWVKELNEIQEGQKGDERYDEWAETYSEWYEKKEALKSIQDNAEQAVAETELNALSQELFTLAKQLKPAVYYRLKDDSLGYDIKISVADLLNITNYFALDIVTNVFDIINTEKELAELGPGESEYKESLRKNLQIYKANISNPKLYTDATAKNFEKALSLALFFNSSSSGNAEDIGYEDLKLVLRMLTIGDEEAFGSYAPTGMVMSIISFVIAMTMLIITIFIAFIRTLKSLFKIGNLEKFFKATSKSFEKTSGWMTANLFVLAIGIGGKMTVFGVLAIIVIVLGYGVCGVLSRCTTLSKEKTLYLSGVQATGLVSAIGAMIVLFSGHRFISGIASTQTCFSKAITIAGSLDMFVIIETLLITAQLLICALSAYFMVFGLKRFACTSVKTKDVNEAKKQNTIAEAVLVFVCLMLPVALSFFGMQLNAVAFLISGILILGVEIALAVFIKKNCPDISKEDQEILNASGRKYFDPEDIVVAPFLSIEDETASTNAETQTEEK